MPTQQLVRVVQDLEDEIRHFQQENEIFSNFLQSQEPCMIAGKSHSIYFGRYINKFASLEMEAILEKARRLQEARDQSVATIKVFSNLELTRSRRVSETMEIAKGPR